MNSRSAQVLAATLAFLLIVLIGATIFILLSRPAPGPTPTPTLPSFGPTPAPSATLVTPLPSATATIPPTPTLVPTIPPTETPTPAPTVTPEPTISPTPSASPTPSPTLPPPGEHQREVTVVDFGVDNRADPLAVQRTISFKVDGPSTVTATLFGVNVGKVRMCLRGESATTQCITAHSGTITSAAFDAVNTDWNVSVIGAAAGQQASVTLNFNALTLNVGLDSFRFNGTSDSRNNGFEVVFGADVDGTLEARGQIDDGHDTPYLWHFNVAADDVTVSDQPGGPSTNVDVTAALTGGSAYAVTFEEPEAATSGGFPVFLSNFHLTYP